MEEWISFKYECLPNLCYWCGRVTHDDKDYVLWQRSKGTMKLEDQQFGPWIKATQFNPSCKSMVEVAGFGDD